MTLLIIAPELKTDTWISELRRHAPDLNIDVWPKIHDPDAIEFALAWNHPHGEFRRYRNLKCIASIGAGVDHLLNDKELPRDIPLTRIVDASMAQSMSEYVVMSVLNYCRHLERYRIDQLNNRWQPRVPHLAKRMVIGILGLGQLGADAARKLAQLGFPVRGWRRTSKAMKGIETYCGDAALDTFLSQSRILICMLPLTNATENILNRRTLGKLPQGAYLINVARGEHLVEEDLMEMIAAGQLSGACLDVFRKEPLPVDHPFWDCPEIVITPHIASLTFPKAVVPQIVDNYYRMKSGQSLINRVNKERGY